MSQTKRTFAQIKEHYEIEKELGTKVKVIATGGLAKLVAGLSKRIQKVDPDLTLKGLRIIAE